MLIDFILLLEEYFKKEVRLCPGEKRELQGEKESKLSGYEEANYSFAENGKTQEYNEISYKEASCQVSAELPQT